MGVIRQTFHRASKDEVLLTEPPNIVLSCCQNLEEEQCTAAPYQCNTRASEESPWLPRQRRRSWQSTTAGAVTYSSKCMRKYGTEKRPDTNN